MLCLGLHTTVSVMQASTRPYGCTCNYSVQIWAFHVLPECVCEDFQLFWCIGDCVWTEPVDHTSNSQGTQIPPKAKAIAWLHYSRKPALSVGTESVVLGGTAALLHLQVNTFRLRHAPGILLQVYASISQSQLQARYTK